MTVRWSRRSGQAPASSGTATPTSRSNRRSPELARSTLRVGGQPAAQLSAVVVRIEVRRGQRRLHCLDRTRRRTKGIFVRVVLDELRLNVRGSLTGGRRRKVAGHVARRLRNQIKKSAHARGIS